jgi:parallel beta-helix repeat protein
MRKNISRLMTLRFAKQLVALAALVYDLPAAAKEINVHPGESIQTAVDAAEPGDRVRVSPGIYHEPGRPCPTDSTVMCAVVGSKDGSSLIGEADEDGAVILENAGGQDTGIAIARQNAVGSQCLTDETQRIQGARVEGFLVRNFSGNGIFLMCVDDWTVAFNSAVNNATYGIFPSHSGRGELHHNIASGAHDTGIYTGQSHDVRVFDNVAHDNVSGFEIENSTNVKLHNNTAFHNTGGILMFIMPGLDILTSHGNKIRDNLVVNNNSPNTCPPGDSVCLVPPGTGILAVAGDHNEVEHNLVLNNETVGIALVDACTAFQIPANFCNGAALGFDPLPESSEIESNTALSNGSNPQSGFPGTDLLWTGNGNNNCWDDNRAAVLFPPQLPSCE